MATRRERVVLDLEDNYTAGVARAAVATGLLKKELNDLSGHSVKTGRDLDKQAKSVEKVGQSSRKAGPDIDKFSGRLRTLADVAVTLGPALVPLGASTIPVLTSALAGLGSAAGAIGVTVLAFKGLGDGIKALQDYHLEPTAENLQKVRVELEKLGPAGAEFVRYLDGLAPTLKDLQNVARSGIFPGVEDGIDDLLTRLPEVTKIVNRLSQEMGDLASEAGSSLASDRWTPFFDYIKTDAAPTLDAFAHSAGNVALGAANLLVAFAPLSRDFTGGLEDVTEAFARWTEGLDDNESFQEFLDYIRESGPEVIDFLGALVSALAGLVQAAAPYGQVVLPALTGVAKAFAAIARSPIGPGLYTAAAALIAFNRASVIAEKSSARLSATWKGLSRTQMVSGAVGGLGLLASSLTDVDDKAGLANTTLGASAGLMAGGPWGLAIGTAIGQVLDFKDAYDQASDAIAAADDALRNGDANAMLKERASLLAQIDKEHPDEGTLSNYFDAVKGSFHDLTGQTDKFKDRVRDINQTLAEGGGLVDLFATGIGRTRAQFELATASAEDFAGALARLNGWFDKRAALRSYKDSIDELRKSMKDGFTREDATNLDNIGRSILQVSQNIKNPKVRGDFLADARAQLADMADHSAPKAARAIQEVINKFDDKGLTHPPIAELKVDDSQAQATLDGTKAKFKTTMDFLSKQRATPTVQVDPSNSFSVLANIQARLAGIRSKSITVTVNQRGGVTSSAGGRSAEDGFASGGFTGWGGHHEPAGVVHRNEVVIPERYARRDMAMLKSRYPDLPGFAGGGLVGSTYTKRGGGAAGDGLWHVVDAAEGAAAGLRGLKKQLDAQQKAYDKAKSTRDDAVSRRDSLSSSIQQGLMGGSIFAESSGSAWASGSYGANTPQGAIAALNARKDRAQRFIAAVNALKQKGVTGAALQAILTEGLEATEAMAAADIGTLSTFSTAENASQQALAAAGLAGGNAVEGDNIRQANKRLDRLHDDLQEVKKAIKDAQKAADKASDKNAKDVTAGVNGAAAGAHRRGQRGTSR